MQDEPIQDPQAEPRWQPISAVDRRVAGVLVEKAKTTPENYPLSLNAVRTASNQKSNRFPQMQLDEETIEESLEHLRGLGATTEIQSLGRVAKYRHLLYAWLGVDKVEMAVMAELLLRGAQTIGELRGRAARMEAIADLSALRPILDSLQSKGLIAYLTPQGRGCVVTHTLYQPDELEALRGQYGTQPGRAAEAEPAPPPPAPPRPQPAADPDLKAQVEALRREVAELKTEINGIKGRLDPTAADPPPGTWDASPPE